MTATMTGPPRPPEPSPAEVAAPKRNLIFTAVLLGMLLAALDQTIMATATRTIADDLHGFNLQAWATTAFLITSTISTPLYGKLSDIYGRRGFFLFAIAIFIVGSFLCGLSQNMYELAAFRAVQGIGAGGLMSMALAMALPGSLENAAAALGLDMREVYGQTENCGVATLMPNDRIKLGSVGKAAPWGEVKICPKGEILIKGDFLFMGYLNQPEKTAETIDARGWLHTGDVGSMDNEGFVKITDRMKDIIITSGGKNITPSEIENQLKFSPYVSDAVVIGDKRPYLTCLVMIDQENVEKFAQDQNIPFTNYASLCRATEIQDLIWREIESVNANFARVETIKKFYLIERQLTPEDEELTPTMKLKRSFVNKRYAAEIDAMYRDRAVA